MIAIRDGVQYANSGGKFYPFKEPGKLDWDNPISETDFHSGEGQ